jgi:hypothetical protein
MHIDLCITYIFVCCIYVYVCMYVYLFIYTIYMYAYQCVYLSTLDGTFIDMLKGTYGVRIGSPICGYI